MSFRCSQNLPPSARILLTRLPRTGPFLRRLWVCGTWTSCKQYATSRKDLQPPLAALARAHAPASSPHSTHLDHFTCLDGDHDDDGGDERAAAAAAAAARTTRMSMTRMIGTEGTRHGRQRETMWTAASPTRPCRSSRHSSTSCPFPPTSSEPWQQHAGCTKSPRMPMEIARVRFRAALPQSKYPPSRPPPTRTKSASPSGQVWQSRNRFSSSRVIFLGPQLGGASENGGPCYATLEIVGSSPPAKDIPPRSHPPLNPEIPRPIRGPWTIGLVACAVRGAGGLVSILFISGVRSTLQTSK